MFSTIRFTRSWLLRSGFNSGHCKEMPSVAKLKKKYASLLGRYPRGRYASDPPWLKREIKRFDQVLKMIIRSHMNHANKKSDPIPHLMREAEEYGMRPDRQELASRAVNFYRALQHPRRTRPPSVQKQIRKSTVTFADCRCDKDCSPGYTCSKQQVCIRRMTT